MPLQILQLLSAIGGALIGGFVTAYASRQTRHQNEIVAMLQTLRDDNKALREENHDLREEVEELRRRTRERRPLTTNRLPRRIRPTPPPKEPSP